MAHKKDFLEIIKHAEKKGYFDLSGLTLSLEEFKELKSLLDAKKIPFSPPSSKMSLSREDAVHLVNSLRKGVPPLLDVTCFNVGRNNLISKFTKDLKTVSKGSSIVRFMNADYGYGKTHSLYLLRDIAFNLGFVVSIVTLSKGSCPIHDFMAVYNRIIWNLRTQDERNKRAIENVLDRWLQTIREKGEERAIKLIKPLSDDLKSALHAYYESVSPLKPNEKKRTLVIKYLSAESVYLRDLSTIGIKNRIETFNALTMLGQMALLFNNLNYQGIAILFDEADPIHSFARDEHQDEAYNNLFKIINESRAAPHCYFLYATTPGFFDHYNHYWPVRINDSDILELDRLDIPELQRLALNLCKIYSIAKAVKVSNNTERLLYKLASDLSFGDTIGNYVRRCIAVLDEGI